MKQPVNKLEVFGAVIRFDIDITSDDPDLESVASIATGRTEQAAWKAARRRLNKMLRFVEQKINQKENEHE